MASPAMAEAASRPLLSSPRADHRDPEPPSAALGRFPSSILAAVSIARNHGTQLPAAESHDAADSPLDDSGPPSFHDRS